MKDDKFEGIEEVTDEDCFCEVEYEDGSVVKFEHVFTVDYKDNLYAVMEPIGDADGFEEGDVEIVRLVKNADDEDDIEFIDDEEFYEVLAEYQRQLQEYEDELEDTEEDQ